MKSVSVVIDDFEKEVVIMFRKFDAGVVERAKDGDKGDCQVRAVSTACGISYSQAWQLLYTLQGELRHCSFTVVQSLALGDKRLGFKRQLSFPAVRGKTRMTGKEFCKRNSKGRFILQFANHVAAVKDGVIYDTWDSSSKCVYRAWEVTELSGAADD